MKSGDEWSASDVAGILCNPVYVGIGPFPPMIDDATWIRAAERQINEKGAHTFLAAMLTALRQSFAADKDAP